MDYEDLYKQYYGRVVRYLGGLMAGPEAEDLAQEVFIKVGKKLNTLKDPSKAASWILKIALNTARDHFRQAAALDKSTPPIDECAPGSPEADEDGADRVPDTQSRSPEESLLRREVISCYLGYVSKLPRHYYEVYVYSEFEELSDKDIAARLSLPLQTVKIRLHRARARLYEELRQHCRCYYNERGELTGGPK